MLREHAELYANEKLDAVFLCVGPKQHPALAIEAFVPPGEECGTIVWEPQAMLGTLEN